MLPKNWGEPTGAPAIFEKQIEIKRWLFFILGLPVSHKLSKTVSSAQI
ncbi:MAG: hypothetical protein P8X79_04690 [Reinekea sp.]